MGKVKENAKRVAILIAVAGFIFSSAALTILAVMQSNEPNNSAAQQQADLLKQLQEQNAPKEPLPGYSAAAFDAASVTELKVETLVQGEGPVATAESTVNANYFGWTADGTIFDSTNKKGTVTPIDFPLSGVITGWTEGLTGVKQGSTVKLTIPAEKAYGAEDKGDGRPVGPLVFIVEVKEVK
jgi:FKBP-type peptidyl-prolyl cis-trans isomerase